MKNILKLLLLCVFLVPFISCSQENKLELEEIGILENNIPKITIDTKMLLSNYNSNLKKLSNINGNFEKVEILKIEDEYVLVFSGKLFVSKFLIVEGGKNENGFTKMLAGGSTSCTSSDCASESTGCRPKTFTQGCSSCNNKGKCTRTTTSRSSSLLTKKL